MTLSNNVLSFHHTIKLSSESMSSPTLVILRTKLKCSNKGKGHHATDTQNNYIWLEERESIQKRENYLG